MKNKKTAYYLIPAVLLVWGYIGVKIYSTMSGGEDLLFDTPQTIVEIEEDSTYSAPVLSYRYSDPFLERSILASAKARTQQIRQKARNQRRQQPSSSTSKRTNSRKPKVNFGFIQYNGSISNKFGPVALLNVRNKNLILSKGEIEEGVEILEIFPDSLHVQYQNQKGTILKK